MKINFKGLVNLHTLPTSAPLLPLYEAIVNSIQSIEDTGINNGKIEIIIERDKQMHLFKAWETDIENIEIIDNGIGFNEDNFNSFDTYASEYKIQKGCKGVGRMLWLKAFQDVNVESVYHEDGKTKSRKFLFDARKEVHDVECCEIDKSAECKTRVKLNSLRRDYKNACPKRLDTIARNILNHCFAFYVLEKAPRIVISDENESIDIAKLYNEQMQGNLKVINLDIKNVPFVVIHSKNYMTSSENHKINFCAHQRVVSPTNLSKLSNDWKTRLEDDKGEFSYAGYVLSDALDEHVNRERTNFNMPEQSNIIEQIGLSDIESAIKDTISQYLEEDFKESNIKKEKFIKDYIFNKNPKYRLLLRNCPELIKRIPWTNDEEKLEMELFKQEQKYRLELKKEGKKIEEEARNEIVDYEKYIERRTAYAEKLSDMGKSNLAEYVMHRKAILDILAQNTKYKDEQQKRYTYEKNIHQLIFPMTKTSDDIDYMQHNLWIIDEKLAYHHYLASDTKLRSMDEIDNESGKEPDILIFDSPFAFTDEETQPYRNITIIEFKRPGREHYTDKENPIKQVKEYMDDIIEGKIKSKDGEFLSNTENIRFFCYILCDIDASMKKCAKMDDLKETPDNMGYYKYIDSYKAYLEVIPYNKLIQDSQKRNKILFDKLFNQI